MYILLYSMVNRYCFVSCIQYILPLNLLNFLFTNVFLHTAEFLHTGEREDFMPAKMEQVCKSRRENDHCCWRSNLNDNIVSVCCVDGSASVCLSVHCE